MKCKSLLICTALAFWLPLLGFICAPRVVFSQSYSEEMTFRLMKFVREQLCSATSNLTEGWRENHRASRKQSWAPTTKCHALYVCVSSLLVPLLLPFPHLINGICQDPLQPKVSGSKSNILLRQEKLKTVKTASDAHSYCMSLTSITCVYKLSLLKAFLSVDLKDCVWIFRTTFNFSRLWRRF